MQTSRKSHKQTGGHLGMQTHRQCADMYSVRKENFRQVARCVYIKEADQHLGRYADIQPGV